jgi:oligopeptide transport system substrate-binding protein
MWKLLLPFLLLVGLLGLAIAGDRPSPRADFVFLNRGDVSTLDIQRMSWMQDLRVAAILFEGLVTNDVFSREYRKRPGVAERWEVSPDFRTYTFHLRADARWSNGQPVTVEDFRFAWRRAILPDTVGDYVTMFKLIEGAAEFYAWRQQALERFAQEHAPPDRPAAARALWAQTLAKFDELVRIDAAGERTLVVRLVRPVPYFLDLVAFEVFMPVYAPMVAQYQHLDEETGRLVLESDWTRPPLLVSNGPFTLTRWRFKRDMRLEANPHYWNRAAVRLGSIEIPTIDDPNASVLAFRTGAVDWLSDVVPDYRGDLIEAKQAFYREHQAEYDRLKAQGLDPVAIDRRLPPDPRKNIHVFPGFSCYFYSFNCLPTLANGTPNPFHDARVRKAFALALDKQTIAQDIRRLGESPSSTLIPPDTLPGYRSPAGLPYDPAAARALLAEAGYPEGRGLPVISILFNKEGGHDLIAQAAAKSWQTNLGVRIALDLKEIKVFRNELKNQNYMIARGGWFGDYGDPTTFLDLSRTGDGNNDRAFSHPRFDQLLAQADAETDPQRRLDILSEAERFLVEDQLPILPIFRQSVVYMFDPHRLSGVSPHPRLKQRLGFADILTDARGPHEPLEIPPSTTPARP